MPRDGGGDFSDAPLTFTAAGVVDGMRRAIPIALGTFGYGLVYGALSREAGLSELEATLSSMLIFAGSAQFVVLDLWSNPVPVVSLILTVLVINARHVLMGAAIAPWLGRLPRSRVALSAFFLTDENWALTMKEARFGSTNGAMLLGSGLALFLGWVGAAIVGRAAGSAIDDPAQWGLDVAFVAVFAALLVGFWEGPRSLRPWLVAAVVAVAADRVLPGVWYVLLGGLAGSVAGAIDRGD